MQLKTKLLKILLEQLVGWMIKTHQLSRYSDTHRNLTKQALERVLFIYSCNN